MEPGILLLLATERASYGYEFADALRTEAMTDSAIDTGVIYRTLRQLESAGCVVSGWEPGDSGPQRRVYSITDLGREHLGDWAAVLERRATQMIAFVDQCRELEGGGSRSIPRSSAK